MVSHIDRIIDSVTSPQHTITDEFSRPQHKDPMKIKLDITLDLATLMAAETKVSEKAVTAATREAGTSLKTAWRSQITGARLGMRLARTIRSEQYPKGRPSLNAAALVWSKVLYIVHAHDTRPLIRSHNGFWLTIPTPAAGQGPPRLPDHPGRVGATHRAAPAVLLSPGGAELAGGGGAAQQGWPGSCLTLKNRTGPDDRADLP